MASTYTLIQSTVLPSDGTSEITFSNIPQVYDDLVAKVSVKGAYSTTDILRLKVNTSTTSSEYSYFPTWYNGNGGRGYSRADNQLFSLDVNGGSSAASEFTNYEFYFSSYRSNKSRKNWAVHGIEDAFGTYSSAYIEMYHGSYKSASPITRLDFTAVGGGGSSTWKANSSIELYGIKNS